MAIDNVPKFLKNVFFKIPQVRQCKGLLSLKKYEKRRYYYNEREKSKTMLTRVLVDL